MRRRAAFTLWMVGLAVVLTLGLLLITWDVTAAQAADPTVERIVQRVTTDRLMTHLRRLTGAEPVLIDGRVYTITTRYTGTEGMFKAAAYLATQYRAQGWAVRYHTYTYGGQSLINVEATLTGTVDPEGIYILSSHFDDMPEPPDLAPGADDDGSGTAATLVAAEVLSDVLPAYTIRLVNFSGEEQGLRGSAAYAADARARGERILGVIQLDMIGWEGDGEPALDLHAGFRPSAIALAEAFSQTIAAYHLGLEPEIVRAGAASASDHSSFWNEGYSASILAIEDYYPRERDFNPYYHTPQDTADAIDQAYFTDFVRAAVGTIARLAQVRRPPPPVTLRLYLPVFSRSPAGP